MSCMLTRANGVRRQAPQALHRLQHPHHAPETLMKRPSGWYTFLGAVGFGRTAVKEVLRSHSGGTQLHRKSKHNWGARKGNN